MEYEFETCHVAGCDKAATFITTGGRCYCEEHGAACGLTRGIPVNETVIAKPIPGLSVFIPEWGPQ